MKKICQIVRLKQKKSKMLDEVLSELRTEYGSYRNIAKLLHISSGSFQNIYMVRHQTQKVYHHKLTADMKQAIVNFCLDGPATTVLPEARHS